MIKEAIILAGGLGTRLKEAVPDKPKSLAPVAGLPFLTYVIRHLLSQGIRHIVFSLGHKHEMIEEFLKMNYSYLNYSIVVEKSPLGTGGAIRLALGKTSDRDVLIVNGDTLFKIDVDDLYDHHVEHQSDCTLALKPMMGFDRYGSVEIGDHGRITRFKEKKLTKSGNINGGVYVLNRNHFINRKFPNVFSFEKDYLEMFLEVTPLHGVIQDKYFVDIGIPQDFDKVQIELAYPVLDYGRIDPSWTLFLDRDGVINVNKDESYVFNKDEFQFIPGVKEAITSLSKVFGKIIIVTNQRGIGKGLMDELALNDIHQYMIDELHNAGGRIDDLYYCTAAEDLHFERKPNPGMLLEAAHMHPEIDFAKSIIVGDKISDMQLGRNAGTYTILIHSSQTSISGQHPDVDGSYASLEEFAGQFS